MTGKDRDWCGVGQGSKAEMGREDLLPMVLLLLLAPAVGSFLGVLVDRLARGEDVLLHPSACRACGGRLGVLDLVPLLSFLILRGRCRSCGARIPAWLFYMEILALGAAVLALAAGGGWGAVLPACLFLWLLLALAVSDLLWLRLPDVLTVALLLLVLGWIWRDAGSALAARVDLGWALIGAAFGVGSFLALRVGYRILRGREGLGLGDVKLMAPLGAFAGPLDLPLLVLIGALLALLGGLLSRNPSGAPEPLRFQALPFGTALCAAAAILWGLRAAHLLAS